MRNAKSVVSLLTTILFVAASLIGFTNTANASERHTDAVNAYGFIGCGSGDSIYNFNKIIDLTDMRVTIGGNLFEQGVPLSNGALNNGLKTFSFNTNGEPWRYRVYCGKWLNVNTTTRLTGKLYIACLPNAGGGNGCIIRQI